MDYNRFIKMLSIDSTSSQERELAEFLAKELVTSQSSVEIMEVGDGTLNLLFSWGDPQIVFCTHLDTVPPYIAPQFDGETFRGRGTCDAKGQIWSLYQACAATAISDCCSSPARKPARLEQSILQRHMQAPNICSWANPPTMPWCRPPRAPKHSK